MWWRSPWSKSTTPVICTKTNKGLVRVPVPIQLPKASPGQRQIPIRSLPTQQWLFHCCFSCSLWFPPPVGQKFYPEFQWVLWYLGASLLGRSASVLETTIAVQVSTLRMNFRWRCSSTHVEVLFLLVLTGPSRAFLGLIDGLFSKFAQNKYWAVLLERWMDFQLLKGYNLWWRIRMKSIRGIQIGGFLSTPWNIEAWCESKSELKMAITDYRKWRTRFLRIFATAHVQKHSVYLNFRELMLLITQPSLHW